MKRVILLWASVAAYALGISFLSHQPSLSLPAGVPDWLLHGIEFAGLGGLVAAALAAGHGRLSPGQALWGALGCAGFGVLDEVHQSFVDGRHAAAGDVLADAAGAGMALAASALVSFILRRGVSRPEIVLIGKRACHLCDEAEDVLRRVLSGRGFDLVKLDIDSREDLRATYGDEIPVVLIEGRKVFKYRVDPDRLRRKLDSIQRRNT